MKKIYLSAVAVACALGANAQLDGQLITREDHSAPLNQPNNKPVTSLMEEKAVLLWENTMDDASDWVMTNSSAPSSIDWEVTTDASAMPNAAPELNPFASATFADGYALINSDGAPGNADGDGAIVADMTLATPIDLSASPNVILKFSHNYRWWHEDRQIRVSGDNGANWTTYHITSDNGGVISSGYPNDQNSENPTIETINISAVAGGQSQVLIQFHYNDNDFWGWYWVVDDVQIFEQPANDNQLWSGWIGGVNNQGIEYGRTPLDQVDGSYNVGGQVYNFGTADQNNLVIDADFTSFTSQSTHALLAAGDTVNMETAETPSLAVGTYSGTYTLQSDEEQSGSAEFGDNTYERVFEITENVYSVDGYGNQPAAHEDYDFIGTGSFNADGKDGLYVMNMYHIHNAEQLGAIRVMLHSSTAVGAEIAGAIYDTANILGTSTDMNAKLHSTTLYTITATDSIAGYKDLVFDGGVDLTPNAYFFAAELYSAAGTNEINIIDDKSVAQPWYATAIYFPGGSNPGVFNNGEGAALRLMVNTVGVEEATLEGVSVYPNPSNGIVNVTNEAGNEHTITVTDMAGRTILTTVASQATTLDLSANGTGIYMINISNGNGSMVERVVVK